MCQDPTEVCSVTSELRCFMLTVTCGADHVRAHMTSLLSDQRKDVALMCALRYILVHLGIKDKQGEKRKVFC